MTILRLIILILILFSTARLQLAQTPEFSEQNFINNQIERLKSGEVETRRDAVFQLLNLKSVTASRAAAASLKDKAEIVRATAAKAAGWLPDEEAAAQLTPILTKDKSEFVRREAAFALGAALSKSSIPTLLQALQRDKKPSVRAAAAIALGEIADERAVPALAQVLLGPKQKKSSLTEDEFVRRSAARALGQTRFVSAVPSLVTALQNVANADDVRREAAFALGLIADKSAIGVLTENLNAPDYLLAQIAANSLQRIKYSKIISD